MNSSLHRSTVWQTSWDLILKWNPHFILTPSLSLLIFKIGKMIVTPVWESSWKQCKERVFVMGVHLLLICHSSPSPRDLSMHIPSAAPEARPGFPCSGSGFLLLLLHKHGLGTWWLWDPPFSWLPEPILHSYGSPAASLTFPVSLVFPPSWLFTHVLLLSYDRRAPAYSSVPDLDSNSKLTIGLWIRFFEFLLLLFYWNC
jgi:hypothetical protein